MDDPTLQDRELSTPILIYCLNEEVANRIITRLMRDKKLTNVIVREFTDAESLIGSLDRFQEKPDMILYSLPPRSTDLRGRQPQDVPANG